MKTLLSKADVHAPQIAKAIAYFFALIPIAIYSAVSEAQQPSPSLTITSPASGVSVTAGQSLNISVSTLGGPFTSVQVIGESIGFSSVVTASPYTLSLSIPSQTVGLKRVVAVGFTAAGIMIFSPSITVDCEPSAAVVGLSVSLSQINFSFPGAQVRLTLEGTLADGSVVDLTQSSRTQYSSGNTAIAIVDSTGLVTAAGPGTTAISIANGGQSTVASVSVPTSLRGDLNADGKVDTDDLNIVLAALNTNATGPFDARDFNGDGVIDLKDVQVLAALCTFSSCSTSSNSTAAPNIVLSPFVLAIGGQAVGSSSTPQSVTVVNSGTAALTIQSVVATGSFTQTNTCSSAIPPAGSCIISVVFSPTAIGLSSGLLTITDNASGSPHKLGLSGTGAQPEVGLGAQNITFPGQLVGTRSSAQTLVVSDPGNADLTISTISISGTNSGDFAITSGGTCPTSGGTLAAGTNCSVNITFAPTGLGTRSGTLAITDNANNSPQTLALTGTGMVVPNVTITPSSSNISTTQGLIVTVAVNGGSGNLTPTGTVTLSSGTYTSAAATLTSGSAQINIPAGSLAAGSDTLKANYTPDTTSASIYNSATGTTSSPVTVSKTTPTVSVTPGSSSITSAQALSVTVAVSGTPTPTGSVTLTCGTYTSAATTLTSGSAQINIPASSLAVGIDTLTASYAGDSNYNATTGTTPVTVTTAVSASFAISGSAVTVAPGATSGNTSTITVTPAGGFAGTVALTASITSSPSGAQHLPTFSFGSTNPVAIVGTSAETATLTISTTAAGSAALVYPKRPGVPWYATGSAVLAGILLFGIPRRRRAWRTMLGMLALLVTLAGGVLACGGIGINGGTSSPGTTAGVYTVTVTGTSSIITQTGTVTLTVK